MKKAFVLTLMVLAIISFFATGLHHHLSLTTLHTSQTYFTNLYTAAPWLTAAAYFLLYVAVTALSLPGAAIMTLAGGALFGWWKGLLLVSFASSIGATLAFLVSRFLLRDWVQQRFGERLEAINHGVEKEGAFYLFTLRLVPAIPFFLINLLMGLTHLPIVTFYWVSQIGMLAGTIAYVNAGTQLAQIDSLSSIISPHLWLSFLLLGMLPWIAKIIVRQLQQRHIYSKFERPQYYDRNLIVIGAGAAGLVSAYIAATVKAKVTLVEAHKMGGDCLNYGCVPSKALIKSAQIAHHIQHATRYGLTSHTSPIIQFKTIMQRVQAIIRQIEPHDSVERYTKLGVEVLEGYATLIDPWTVEIALTNGAIQRLTTRNIILATGAKPFVPPLAGIEKSGYVTSDTLWERFAQYDTAPKQLIVLGGGAVGCELAQSFARLGSNVTLIEHSPHILAKEDTDVRELIQQALQNDGVQVLTQHHALRFEYEEANRYLVVAHNGIEQQLAYDEIICAVGRRARLSGYGLEALGIPTEHTVTTNEYLETLYPNIYAAGDVAGPYQLTHIAAHQAWYAAVNALFGRFKRFAVDYRVIPYATFVDPEIARVGLNEQEAKERNIAYEITYYGIDDLDRAITDSNAQGFVKILTPPHQDKILGVTIVGTHAGDLLAEYVLAMKHGLGLNKILGTIHIYPTWSEANKYAAGEWKKAHAPQRLLAWIKRYHDWQRG